MRLFFFQTVWVQVPAPPHTVPLEILFSLHLRGCCWVTPSCPKSHGRCANECGVQGHTSYAVKGALGSVYGIQHCTRGLTCSIGYGKEYWLRMQTYQPENQRQDLKTLHYLRAVRFTATLGGKYKASFCVPRAQHVTQCLTSHAGCVRAMAGVLQAVWR